MAQKVSHAVALRPPGVDALPTRPLAGSSPQGEVFADALSGLGPIELRVVHLAMNRAALLEAQGRGAEADALLLGLLRITGADDGAERAPLS